MRNESANRSFISALRYPWLTPLYDFFLVLSMPEDRIKQALVREATVLPASAVLDFGCGSATLTIMLKKAYPGTRVTGIDADPQILEVAKGKIANAAVDIALLNYDGQNLPFEKDAFENVFSCLVFHHLYGGQKKTILKQLHLSLRTGGELLIADFGRSANPLQRLLFLPIRVLDGFKPTAANAKGELPSLITAAGFKRVTVSKYFRTFFGEVQIIKAIK